MKQKSSNTKKIIGIIAVTVISLLWLGYQVYLWDHCYGSFEKYSRKIIEIFDITIMNRQYEWMRAASVLCYLQTLPSVLLAYCLFIKWPGKRKLLRAISVALMFAASLLAVPKLMQEVFINYKNIFSPNNVNYWVVILVHSLLSVAGVLTAWALTIGKWIKNKGGKLFELKAMGNSVYKYLLTFVISFLVVVAYGFVLSVLNHFNSSAVSYILRSFAPDAGLISGIITMAVMAPLMEEMAFRGLMMTKMKQYSSSAWAGVIFSSVLFGAWHRNLGQFFATFIMGVIFSWVYLKTGKLRFAMVAHCVSNVFLAIAASSNRGYLPYLKGLIQLKGVMLDTPLAMGIIGLLATFALIFFLIFKGYGVLEKKIPKNQ